MNSCSSLCSHLVKSKRLIHPDALTIEECDTKDFKFHLDRVLTQMPSIKMALFVVSKNDGKKTIVEVDNEEVSKAIMLGRSTIPQMLRSAGHLDWAKDAEEGVIEPMDLLESFTIETVTLSVMHDRSEANGGFRLRLKIRGDGVTGGGVMTAPLDQKIVSRALRQGELIFGYALAENRDFATKFVDAIAKYDFQVRDAHKSDLERFEFEALSSENADESSTKKKPSL